MKTGTMRYCTLYVFFLLGAKTVQAQKQYEFNHPGSPCYFRYVCYAPDGDYTHRRPVLFQLGKPGEQAMDVFRKDTLKEHPDFLNYLMVYIPNSGTMVRERLKCLKGLSSLLTWNYEYGRAHLFLVINDPDVDQLDINISRIGTVFPNIRLTGSASLPIAAEKAPDIDSPETDKTVRKKPGKNVRPEELSKTSGIKNTQTAVYNGPPKTFNFTLSGTVKDAQTGETLPFSTVYIAGTTQGVTTNTDGHFTLHKVPSDTSTLVVSYLGYDEMRVKLNPDLPKSALVLEVEPASTLLNEVHIVAEKEELMQVMRSGVSTVRMTPKKLEQLPNVGEKDIMRSFQLMPGISASNESSSGMYVRGGTPDQNLIIYDGFTIYHVDHLFGFFSAFNSNAIKDVQLHKGGFESRFGERLSSVMEITGKDGNQKNFNIGGDVSLLSMNAFTEIPIGDKFTSLVAFRRSYRGPIYNIIFNQFNTSHLSSSAITAGSRL